VIVYDNDAEGVAKLKATNSLSLPHNVRVMKLPPLDDFKSFQTDGPTGPAVSDINGKAASIKCYLDMHHKSLPDPIVRWSSFNNEAEAWHGTLLHKTQYMKRFLALRGNADDYDTAKIESVLDALVSECVAIAESTFMMHPLRINE
jgi:hypothetical protein